MARKRQRNRITVDLLPASAVNAEIEIESDDIFGIDDFPVVSKT
jgi:hypothetical protein